ncbi:O-antigen ligase family protein [Vibrio genomosp. F6]|nr:O-antigen ligase [Vibrio genomosp. F6]TKF22563.1 O-antigen ligase family protein [Vibrio genomosp. F6]
MPFIEKITFTLFLIFIFWLPIPLGSNRPLAWSFNEIWLALIMLSCLFIFPLKHWVNCIKRTIVIVLPLLITATWSLIQSIPNLHLSQDPGLVLVSALKGFHYLQLCLVSSVLIYNSTTLKLLATVMLAAGITQAFYASVINLLHLDHSLIFELPLGSRASGSFVYHNHLANFLMLNLCIGFGLLTAQLADSKSVGIKNNMAHFLSVLLNDKTFVRLGLIIMVIALVLTRSRMGNVSFFIALVVGCALLLKHYKLKSKSVYILIFSLFIVDTFIVSNWFGLEKIKQRLVATSLETESRDDVIEYSLAAVKERPLSGFGAGTFYSTFPAYNQGNVQLFYDHTHNDYIQFTLEYGLVTVMLLGGMIVLSARHGLKAFKRRKNRLMRGIGLSSLMAIIGMTVHMSVDFPLQAPATAMYFILCLMMAHWSLKIPSSSYKTRGTTVATVNHR